MTPTTLAALFLAAGTAGAQPAAGPERSTAVVRGDLGRKLDEYLSRLEALGYSGGLAGRYRAPSGAQVSVRAVEGGLEVTGSDPAGLALLAGLPAAERERYERLGARTADIAGRSFEGDPTGIHEALGGLKDLEQIRQQDAELMRDREGRLGPFRGYALVDASPYGEGRVETAVRVDFERGSVYNRFLWGPRDGLVGLQAGPEPPGARYVAVSEQELVAFRLDGGGGPQRRVAFEGGATVLVVPGPDGPVRLPRVP